MSTHTTTRMRTIAVIGSEEIRELSLFADLRPTRADLESKVELRSGHVGDTRVLYAPRAGTTERRKCHEIDYRSVMRALRAEGATHVVSTAMVGGLSAALPVGHLCLLDQFLDFTRHRQFTFFDGDDFDFLDMTEPFCDHLRDELLRSAAASETQVAPAACYVGVDGPRYETRAEVAMYRQLGGDVIGMTIVPEVIMAREAGLCYATLAGVVNPGAGLSSTLLDAAGFRPHRSAHAAAIERILTDFVERWATSVPSACACPRSDVC